MKLPYLFSSDALFQAESTLTIHGASTAPVSAEIIDKAGNIFSKAAADCDGNGNGQFSLTLDTPAASFDPYTVRIVGDEEKIMERVLFGELWLASGQSNMELPNWSIPEHRMIYEKLSGKNIRFFHVDYQDLNEKTPFPYEPQPYGKGSWILPETFSAMNCVSAIATEFAGQIYDYLNADRNVPVGILDASWGGTPIVAWLDRKDIDADEAFSARIRALGNYPDAETWNNRKGCCTYQQPTAQYNVKIAPLIGAKVRGIIWYQGENETWGEHMIRSYADYLRFYHKTYTEKFACDKAHFPMISSLLHYWTYGTDGECKVGYSNEAFVETALEAPDTFMFVPNGDLQPVWAQHQYNHPIHPAHKYQLADRFAKLAIANVYGGNGQKQPATLEKVRVCRGSLKLYFRNARPGLRIGGGAGCAPAGDDGFRPVHTLYVAGKDHKYLPAEARVIGKNVLEVRCDGMKSPKYAVYNMQSMEPFADLFCGEYPVTPFRNDDVQWLDIQARPWYDMNNTCQWADKMTAATEYDMFNRPVWHAAEGCEVCADPSFRFETDKSLRISTDDEENTAEAPVIAAHVRSYPYARLTFDGYSKLTLNAFNCAKFDAELVLIDKDGEHSFKLENKGEIMEDCGWYRLSANIRKAPKEASRMMFRFTAKEKIPTYRFVNIERIRLIP